MRSFQVISGESILAQNITNLRHDAKGAGSLLVHQQLGAIALPSNPTNGQTLTLTINGTAVVITFVSAIGTSAGNVLIGASAAATLANLLGLLNQPQTTTSNGVALSAANQTLVSYLTWPLSGTTITPSSNNTSLYAPLTSFTAATTVTGGSYTAQTMQLYVEPGVVYVGGIRVIFAGGSTPPVTAPAANPRIDVLAIDNTGTLSWTTGTENANPSAPTYPANKAPLCELYNVVGETALYDNANQQSGQGYIYNDVRPMVGTAVNLGAVTQSILPASDATYDIGSGGDRWNNVYAVNYYGNASNMTGLTTYQLTQTFTAGASISAGSPVYLATLTTGSIAFDNSAVANGVQGNLSTSYTVGSGSNRVLYVLASAYHLGGTTISAMTYGGVSMTLVSSVTYNTNFHLYLFRLVAPATGANTLTSTVSNTSEYYSYAIVSYSGVNQTTPEEGSRTDTGSGTSISEAITTTSDGDWVLLGVQDAAGGNVTAGSNLTMRQTVNGIGVGDNNTFIHPAGSLTQTATVTSGAWGAIQIGIVPATAPVTNTYVYPASASSGTTANSFIGFAQTSVSNGQSVLITVGGIDTHQSALSPGALYYLGNTAGTIGTSAGSVTRKVGIAISATAILITNVW